MDDGSLAAYSRYGDAEILDASQTNPVRIRTAGVHGRADGDQVRIQGVVGMVELNGNDFYLSVFDDNELDLYLDEGLTSPEDGTGHTAFSSPATGEFVLAIEVVSPEFLAISWRLTY